MSDQLLLLLICGYAVLLFSVAWLSERYSHYLQQPWWRPLVYTLSIGVYCSSWTFLGAVGQTVKNGWHFLPIYLGPILLVVFGWNFLRRLLFVSARNKVTSIADFIGSRYGKNQTLAAIVTLVLVVGTLPYIALQLRAVGLAWETVRGDAVLVSSGDSIFGLATAMVMACFAILFGTRVIDGPDRLRGMVTAVATESVVKLMAFIVVAGLAIFYLFRTENPVDVLSLPSFSYEQIASPLFITEMLLAAIAIVCLPRQFQLMVVEYHQRSDLKFTRWMLPLYLAIFAVLAIPLAAVGVHFFGGTNISPDSYVLTFPRWANQDWILALTFLGALSAATGMVIVATIALSIMISNELVVPLWLRKKPVREGGAFELGASLRLIRRFSIVVLLGMGWALERLISSAEGLASMGLISFAATAQLMPAVVGALYWSKGHVKGVMLGLLVGMGFWFYCLLLPVVLTESHPLIERGLWGVVWLSPYNFLGMGWLDPLSHGVFWSLVTNFCVFVFCSRRAVLTKLDLRQAKKFIGIRSAAPQGLNLDLSNIDVQQLQNLMKPLFGVERTMNVWQDFEQRVGHRLLPHDRAPKFTVQEIESDLAAIIGAVSAHRSMELLSAQKPLQLQDFVSLVGGTSRQIQFSQTLLQTTLETIPQGISVVDKDLHLVAWNQQYQNLFSYPQRLLYVGCAVDKIYRYNAERGYLEFTDCSVEEAVQRRIEQLTSGKPHRLERVFPSGEVIEIRGTPLANGGYVTTYTDVTEYHQMVEQLEIAKETLEERVADRTQELRSVNETLQRENEIRARVEQELKEVYASKNRFLAAASHDLLQPINAARLFVASLSSKTKDDSSPSLLSDVSHLDHALASAEQLISSLREISRLESGKEQANRTHVAVETILQPLAGEAQVLAEKQHLEFRWMCSSAWVQTDPHLLRRVVQNFISNALRYTQEGRVLLGCRRQGESLSIEVWDTGPGIADHNKQKIFEEFERLPGPNSGTQGLGLGLSIAQRISVLLRHPISVISEYGKGSAFKVLVPLGEEQEVEAPKVAADPHLNDLPVLCIDNDQEIQAGMQSLLEQWGCKVTTVSDLRQALANWKDDSPPQLILADYHLDTETGLDVLEALSYHWQQDLSAIIISADNSDELRKRVQEKNYLYLSKPVQPIALRTLMRRALRIKTLEKERK